MQYLTINTPLGEVNFFVFGVTPAVTIHLDSVPLSPALPPGMSVQGCLGILLRVGCHEAIEDLIFECRLLERNYSDHYYEGGEHLYAHTWGNEHSVLMIGTEDEECLNARLPENQQYDFEPLESSEKGVSLSLPRLEKGSESSFHFISAWNNLPVPEDIACCYAVDFKHTELLKNVRSNHNRA
ncbi:hypothetical protein [Gimesia fumaroli]|uniref:Uncharacterized protein n=1 Tax=Gimesia fumaroli TaxID=2527976 RepID=A0A518II45_9PLAN|nr:hypothetical protein [Gimesia fumaroli]QDV52758.1 hypothetical protein Enr17x_48250 [Gimesia fumaroli]